MKTRQRSGELACLRGVRVRWTAEVAQQVLAAQEASGESLASFARRQGLQVQRLHWWRSRLADWGANRASSARASPGVCSKDCTCSTWRLRARAPTKPRGEGAAWRPLGRQRKSCGQMWNVHRD